MRTYKLTIAYDGTRYQGWQRQADTDRTIQGILERAISGCAGHLQKSTVPGERTPASMRRGRLPVL